MREMLAVSQGQPTSCVQPRIASVLLRILRVIAGLALAAMATPLLIQGGFSRYAKFGVPPHPDWRYLALAICMLAAASVLIRPYWWRHAGRH